MRKMLLASVVAVAIMVPFGAIAGLYSDFEAQMRDAYGDYRVALFQSNTGNVAATTQALGSLAEKWSVLDQAWSSNPPPQYVDDPSFPDTVAAVAKVIDLARQKVRDGDLAAAHVVLEEIRNDLGALHLRNGLMGFSDRMNAYHAKMEAVLSADYAGATGGGLERLREDAAVLAYLAHDVVAHPAPNAADPAYDGLVKALADSVAALQAAARGTDPEAALAARGGLKPAYAKLFAKFG